MNRLVAWALSLLLAVAPASAQMMATGVGGGGFGGGAAAAPTVTFVSSQQNTGGGGTSTLTWTGANIGNPAYISTRRVLLVLSAGAAATSVTSATINLQNIDQNAGLGASCTSTACVDFISAPVSSGTTGVNISITFSGPVGVVVLGIYNVDNSLLSSSTPIVSALDINGSGTGTNTATVNTTTKAGGFMLAGAWVGGGAGPSITSSTETYTTDLSNSANFAAHANGISSNASNSISTQGPPAGGNSASAVAAWR